MLIEDLSGMLEEADLAPISARRVLSESSSMLWGSGEGVTSRDNVGMFPGELETGEGSCIGVDRGYFSS